MGGGNLISPFFYTSEVGYFRFKKKNISQQLDSIKPLHGKKKKNQHCYQTTSKMLNLLIGNQQHILKRICDSYFVLNLYRAFNSENQSTPEDIFNHLNIDSVLLVFLTLF